MMIDPPFWHPAHCSAFIFDWDGVLVDGPLDFSPLRDRYFGGRRVMLLEEAERMEEPLRSRFLADLEDLEVSGASSCVPVDGALDLIAHLESRGIPWAVVSRNCRRAMEAASLAARVPLPEVTLSRDDFHPPKPDPAPLLHAARLLGTQPHECAFVGDFVYDLLGGRRARMRSILVNRLEEKWLPLADLSLPTLRDLLAVLGDPTPLVPWEYSSLARSVGEEELKRRFVTVALVEARPGFWEDAFLAASLGCGGFVTLDLEVDASMWALSPSMPVGALGRPLGEVLGAALRETFPLVRVLDDWPDPVPVTDLLVRWTHGG
ncbi:HAD-superfamily hydrolase, subfamily IA, variant 3 [Thermanaerovibrio acidaminovorans DSM 6589]|uniref:HAD-superfamily hydrolase, subfamily IA, variant 3 n=2 Tax=Thermanaerovibrio TaxID=81461 RepID=D1B929_THEAS|nr:HAD-superfamily hydrolase, subfamily IA, variant 3 [Thermanaerovibrio acidaminovorans DSM 6589]